MEEESLKKWYYQSHTCVAGRPATYKDLVVEKMEEGFGKSFRGTIKDL